MAKIIELNFDSISPTLIEGPDDLCIEEQGGEMSDFRMPTTEEMNTQDFSLWMSEHITVVFDGDLDDPSCFSEIEVVGISVPSQTAYTSAGLSTDLTLYLNVTPSEGEVDDEMIDDLFHLIVFEVDFEDYSITLSNFEGYCGEVVDETPELVGKDAKWSN
jgi:hypothetical protein